MADDRLIIDILLDDGAIAQSFKKLGQSASDFSDSASEKITNSFKNVGKGIFSMKTAIAGLGVAFSAAFAGKRFVEAAAIQQDAVNSLNTSLALAGRFSQEASLSFQNFATSLQNASTVGDETILSLGALASNFARSNEEAEKLTLAAVELSAATGIELEGAVKNLGKTFAGLTGELGESIPALRDLTKEQLQSGQALDFVLERFGGAAASKLNTFSGAVQASSNAFGDLQEELGKVVTDSPAAVAIINELRKLFIRLGSDITTAFSKKDFIRELLFDLVAFGKGVNDLVIVPLEALFNVVNLLFEGLKTGVQTFIFGIASAASAVASFFAPGSELATNLAIFKESSQEVLGSFITSTNEARGALVDFSASANFDQALINIQDFAMNATEALSQPKNAVSSLGEQVVDTSLDISQNLQNAARASIGSLALLTKGLANGENGFQNFGKAVLGIIGDLAIQIGTSLVSIGLGIDALKKSLTVLSGGFAIAAGLALIAVGGLLKGLSGGSGGLAGTPGPQPEVPAAGGFPTGPEFAGSDQGAPEPRNEVTVNIQGDVLDSEESSLRIVQLLEREIRKSGSTVVMA